jgi:predicted NUDIX family NTP pyrophosphohydrolase
VDRVARRPALSAGILLFRPGRDGIEVLLGHMGGPFWARRDDGAWSMPKGEHGGKRLTAFALAGDLDADAIASNMFELEWPRGSGRMRSFPEFDRAAWFDPDTARRKLVRGQVEFVDRLLALVAG